MKKEPLNHEIMEKVLWDIGNERIRQHQKYGYQKSLSWGEQIAILGEEFGELCQALMVKMDLDSVKDHEQDNSYEESIQVAAVAGKIAELILLMEQEETK